MISYLTQVFSRALNQMLLLFGGVFVLAVLLCFFSTRIRAAGESVLGEGYYYLVAPGVVCHETGHALGCILTGSEIVKFCPFKPNGHALGSVTYREHNNRFLASLSKFVIASGPVWFGCLIVYLMSIFFTKGVKAPEFNEIFINTPSPSTRAYCFGVLRGAGRLLVAVCRIRCWASPVNIVCLYLLLCVVSEMTLSFVDITGLVAGMAGLAALFLMLNVIPILGSFVSVWIYRFGRKLFKIHVLMTFVLLVDFFFFLLVVSPLCWFFG